MNKLAILIMLVLFSDPVFSAEIVEINKLRAIAERGDAKAQDKLGSMYLTGSGVPRDYKTAAKWYHLSAAQGSADAQFNLGLIYSCGPDGPCNDKEAVNWLRLAAMQGHARAQFQLGVYYSSGRGVSKDLLEAYAWYSIAAENGEDFALNNKMVLEKRLSSRQIEQAQNRAKEILGHFSTKQGDPERQNDLACRLLFGMDVPQDDKEAARLFRLAAKRGNARAQRMLALMYEEGMGVRQDDKEAAKWCRLAAEQGDVLTQSKFGSMYAAGRGVIQSYEDAYAWWAVAAANGDEPARENMEKAQKLFSTSQIERGQQLAKQVWTRLNV